MFNVLAEYCSCRLNSGKGQGPFHSMLSVLFGCISAMMTYTQDSMLTVQVNIFSEIFMYSYDMYSHQSNSFRVDIEK